MTAAVTPSSTPWDLFAAPLSPFAAEAENGTRAWVRRMRMVRAEAAGRRFDAARFGRLTGRAYGTASRGDLRLATDWVAWLFLVHDRADGGSNGWRLQRLEALLSELLALLPADGLAPTPVRASPLAAGLADLWRRTAPMTAPPWRRRFVGHLTDCFRAHWWEAANRAAGRVPALAEFVPARRVAGGMWPALDLIELVEHLELPDALYHSRPFQALLRAVCDLTLWTNDVVGVERERARGDVPSLVVVLQHEYGCSRDAAVERAHAMVDDRLQCFLRTEQELLSSSGLRKLSAGRRDDVLRCIRLARTWARGYVDWAAESPRYRDTEPGRPGQPPTYLDDLVPPAGESAGLG